MTFAEQFRRDGYVVLPDAVWLPPHVQGVRARFQEIYNRSPDAFRAEARLLAKRTSIMKMFLAPDMMKAVAALGIRRPIMQTNPVCHAMGYDLSFDGTHPHQDWPALQSGLNTVVAWIPFHPVDEDSYPVEVAPGSHLKGLLPAKAGEHYSEVDAGGMEFVPVPVPAGGVLLFSVFTVHRTRTPGTKTRVAISHRYEDALDPFFVQNGHYSAQRRVIERELKMAPTQVQVQAVFA